MVDFRAIYDPLLDLPQLGDEGFEERMERVPDLFGEAP